MRNVRALKSQTKAVLLIGLVYGFFVLINRPIGCIIERVLGINCPSCGITRAWMTVLRGDIGLAFYYHPLFLFPLIGVILYVVNNNILVKNSKVIDIVMTVMLIIYIVLYIVRMFYDIEGIIPLDREFNLIFL